MCETNKNNFDYFACLLGKAIDNFCCRCIIFAIILLTLLSSHVQADAKAVHIAGSDSVLRCHRALIQGFVEQGGKEVVYTGGGTLKGIRLFCEGKAEVAVVGIKLEENHKKLLAKAFPDPNKQPREMIFSQTALVFIVNPHNPLKKLTYKQLKTIYMGKTKKWSEVGGAAKEINLYGPGVVRNSSGILRKEILKITRWPADGVTFCGRTKDVIERVSKDRYGIGYIPAPSTTVLKKVKALAIAKDENSKAVAPERENLLLETYPLVLKVKFLIHPDASQAALKYCKYACSEKVAEIVRKYGFSPVSEREQLFMQKRLREMKAGKGDKVAIVGSKTCQKLVKDLSLAFVKAKAVIRMKYSAGDERAAVGRFATAGAKAAAGEKVSANSPQLLVLDGAMSEKTRDAYREKLAAAKPVRHVLAARGVAVIVNPKNLLKSITAEQVVEVFRGKAKSWADVAGAKPAGKTAKDKTADGKMAKGGKGKGGKGKNSEKNKNSQIVRYSPDPTKDAAVKYFHREILQANRCCGVQYRKTADSVIGFVASNPGGIGVIDVNDLAKTAAQAGVKVLAIGPAGKAALPTPKNLLAGKYPLARQVIMYVLPNADEATKDFVKFILSAESSETFAKAGLVTAHSEISIPKPEPAEKKDDKNKNLPKWKKDKEKSKAPGGW